ncbi:hypothetical protein K2173_027441 [Erythroxylum novogranatense]|uniref:Uncharacterized protein n=1 Tax=Erythroxylum novogranatense TaxID=1862640 RepID=A0AAV8U1W2_9ROSI|nr:hypothetical protein K2173_027441 [Erythroxylum novogranatense]
MLKLNTQSRLKTGHSNLRGDSTTNDQCRVDPNKSGQGDGAKTLNKQSGVRGKASLQTREEGTPKDTSTSNVATTQAAGKEGTNQGGLLAHMVGDAPVDTETTVKVMQAPDQIMPLVLNEKGLADYLPTTLSVGGGGGENLSVKGLASRSSGIEMLKSNTQSWLETGHLNLRGDSTTSDQCRVDPNKSGQGDGAKTLSKQSGVRGKASLQTREEVSSKQRGEGQFWVAVHFSSEKPKGV